MVEDIFFVRCKISIENLINCFLRLGNLFIIFSWIIAKLYNNKNALSNPMTFGYEQVFYA